MTLIPFGLERCFGQQLQDIQNGYVTPDNVTYGQKFSAKVSQFHPHWFTVQVTPQIAQEGVILTCRANRNSSKFTIAYFGTDNSFQSHKDAVRKKDKSMELDWFFGPWTMHDFAPGNLNGNPVMPLALQVSEKFEKCHKSSLAEGLKT